MTGQVKNPIELSLKDLKERFKVVTLPVTLVCAGSEFEVSPRVVSSCLELVLIPVECDSRCTLQTGGRNKTL